MSKETKEQIGKEENFEIHSLELLGINETLPTSENQISSTAIREALLNGDLEKANMMLGRPYEVRGHVTEGDSRGRELGFPTANIRVPSERLLPLDEATHRTSLADKHNCRFSFFAIIVVDS